MSPSREVARAAELIRAGRLVAFPTETVYGLGANALDEAAVARIFEAKGRPRHSPLIVHVASIEMARELAADWPPAAEALAHRYWPGPLTLVVPKRPVIPDIVTAGLPTVALRMPAHPMALELIRLAGVPVAAPSANRFTELSPTAAAHVPQSLADVTLDGGPANVGIESTVLSLAGPPVLLRPGVIPVTELEAVVGPIAAGAVEAGASHASPGMHPRHYRPRTPLYLGTQPREGRGVLLRIGHEMPADPRAYAAALYGTLHRLDTQGLDWIAVEMPPDTAEWAGVRDRLRRASRD
ncbi:MAG TPA: L-threonylcarbamoyladenylate synthase [Candidatus Acidoferrales bacterium]|nr:L-threonylcarbamoyladenylate synthase [Candidatus Acidoferrales bacterium]